jgi:hypothetical protein
MITKHLHHLVPLTVMLLIVAHLCFGNAADPIPPDLTKSLPKDTKKAYNLGPTGAEGWMFAPIRTTLSGRHSSGTVHQSIPSSW